MSTKIPKKKKKKFIGNKTFIEITEHRVHDGEHFEQATKIQNIRRKLFSYQGLERFNSV